MSVYATLKQQCPLQCFMMYLFFCPKNKFGHEIFNYIFFPPESSSLAINVLWVCLSDHKAAVWPLMFYNVVFFYMTTKHPLTTSVHILYVLWLADHITVVWPPMFYDISVYVNIKQQFSQKYFMICLFMWKQSSSLAKNIFWYLG